MEIIVHPRKADEEDGDSPSPVEKVVTVDVEMGGNEAHSDEAKDVAKDPLVTDESDAKEKVEADIPNVVESAPADSKTEKTPTENKDETKVIDPPPEVKSVRSLKNDELDTKAIEPEEKKADEEKAVKEIPEKENSEVKAVEPKD